MPDDNIKTALSVSDRTFSTWTKFKRDEQDTQLKKQIYELWMRCEKHENIAEVTGYDRTTITKFTQGFAENVKNGKIADIHIFRDFEQENSTL